MKQDIAALVIILIVCGTTELVWSSALRQGGPSSGTNIRSRQGGCRRCICHLEDCPPSYSSLYQCVSNESMCCCCLPANFPCMDMEQFGLFESNSDDLAELEIGTENIGPLE